MTAINNRVPTMTTTETPKLRRNERKAKTAKSLLPAVQRAGEVAKKPEPYQYPVMSPKLVPGVVPEGVEAPVMAMDYSPNGAYGFASAQLSCGGFPGFQYLAQLATRAEYRAFAATMSTELTREWIEFTSKENDAAGNNEKIKQIQAEFERLDVRGLIQTAAQHDCYFGRAQLFIDIQGADPAKPLILDPRTIKMGSLNRISAIEAVWTTPNTYNANDPSAPDFYRPSSWFMLGTQVHAQRLMTIITRPLPDILKPAFNFAGISLSQLAEAYVDNWLRTRQSVADLLNNFSITVLSTDMAATLADGDDGTSVIQRAQLFNATRSNLGLMLLDKDRETLTNVSTSLAGLHELQAQAQEHMCSVSRIPAIVLTGISPSGLNASSDGEIAVFYDWIAAQQESFWRSPIDTILKCVQLNLFGEIDPDIGFEFIPLYQMTPKELADIRKSDSEAGINYINAGVIDPTEERERLANDPTSGYQGLDITKEIVPPAPPPAPGGIGDPNDDEPPPAKAMDADFKEGDHPRDDGGKFGSGSGGGVAYHGTDFDFDKFDDSKANQKDPGFLGTGHYFSTDKNVGRTNKHLMSVELDVKNPMMLKMENFKTDKRSIVRSALGLEKDATAKEVTAAAKKLGHDSIVLDYSPTGYNHQEIVVFSGGQTKVVNRESKA